MAKAYRLLQTTSFCLTEDIDYESPWKRTLQIKIVDMNSIVVHTLVVYIRPIRIISMGHRQDKYIKLIEHLQSKANII